MSKGKKVVLWLASPFLLIGAAILVVYVGIAIPVLAPLLNILSFLFGAVGVLMLFVGPIVAIVIASRKN